jgi:hypothetical protein
LPDDAELRSGVEALPIDVTVVNDRGEPIRDLIVSTSTSGSTAGREKSSAPSGLQQQGPAAIVPQRPRYPKATSRTNPPPVGD